MEVQEVLEVLEVLEVEVLLEVQVLWNWKCRNIIIKDKYLSGVAQARKDFILRNTAKNLSHASETEFSQNVSC